MRTYKINSADEAIAELWGSLCPDCGPFNYDFITTHILKRIAELEAKVAELERDKALDTKRMEWLGSNPAGLNTKNPIYHSPGLGWTWGWNEGYYLGEKDFDTFREAVDAAMAA